MITLITGCSGTGKTLAALNFAQEPGTLYFVGDEGSGDRLQERAAHFGLDVSKTVFVPHTEASSLVEILTIVGKAQQNTRFTRVVVDDVNAVPDMGFGNSHYLLDLANKYGLHILMTVHTRRVSKDIEESVSKLQTEDFKNSPASLRFIASDHLHLDPQFDTRPTGVLVKSRTPLRDHAPDELFGVKLRSVV